MKAAGLCAAGTAAAGDLALGNGLLSGRRPNGRKPNIIFILADDYGIGEVGCYGADHYLTPHIDRLAKRGIRFTHAYTPSLCGPSRATIMTGRYLFRTGATNQRTTGEMKASVETFIPVVLKQAGYVSSCIGKWGQLPLGPAEFGFDDYLRYSGSGIYWNTQANGKTYIVNGEKKTLGDNEYMPDLMHAHMVNFISQHRDQPFYVFYSLSHVHGQILPTPDSVQGRGDDYTDNVSYMDKLVGKLVDELERLELRERTVVVFFGDNGTAGGRAKRATIGGRTMDSNKGSMQEGGNRVPLIVSWPGAAPEGTVTDHLMDSSDLLPTFAELAEAPLPEGKVIDGQSFASTLLGGTEPHREWVFLQLARQWYVRDAGWKLNQAGELFDMKDAPFTEKAVPVDTKDPDAVAARQRLQKALDELNPAGGYLDEGDGSGRHANKAKKRAAKQAAKEAQKKSKN